MMKRALLWAEGFLKEDNGNLSSMRLCMLFAVLVLVPGYLLACAHWPHLKEMGVTVFTFAASLVGLKAAQKTTEEKPPP